MAEINQGLKDRRWTRGIGALIYTSLILAGAGVWWFTWGPGASGDGASQDSLWPSDLMELAIGRSVHRTYCAECHGIQGEGAPNWQQQNFDGTFPPPPHDSTGHAWHHSDDYLYRIIRDGGQFLEQEMPGFTSVMPAWGDSLSPEEIQAVITYIKSLWGPVEQAFQDYVQDQVSASLDYD